MARSKRNVILLAAGNALYALSQWVMLALLVKFGSAEIAGEYAIALAITAPVMLLLSFGLRQAQATDVQDSFSFTEYLALRSLLTCAGIAVIAAAAPLVASSHSFAILLAVALSKGIFALNETYGGLLHRHERMDAVGVSLILRAVGGVLTFAPIYIHTGDLVHAILGSAGSHVVVLLLYDAPQTRRTARATGRPTAIPSSRHRFFQLARRTAPLGISSMLTSISANLPRYLIEALLGTAAVGIFSAVGYPLVAVGVFINAAHQTSMPALARAFAGSDGQSIRATTFRMHRTGVGISVLVLVGSWAVGDIALELLYGESFGGSRALLICLAGAGIVNSLASSYNHVAIARQDFRLPPLAVLAAITTGLVSGLLLIPVLGLIGAAAASAVAFATQASVLAIALRSRNAANSERRINPAPPSTSDDYPSA